MALLEAMEDLFELFESDAIKVILYYANRPKIADIIEKALRQYAIILSRRQYLVAQSRICLVSRLLI